MTKTSNNTVKQILNNLDALVYVVDAKTYELLFVNDKLSHLDGFDIQLGQPCWKVLQKGEPGPCSFCTIKALQKEPKGKVVEWKCRNTLNNRWYQLQDQLIEWEDGRFARLEIAQDIDEKENIRFTQDITTLKKNPETLQRTVEKFRSYLNMMPVSILIFDEKGFIKEVNPAFVTLTGLEEKILIGKNIKSFVLKKNHDSFDKGMEILLTRGAVKGVGVLRFGTKQQKALSYHGLKLDDHSYLSVILDVTAERRAEEVLKLNEQRYRTVFEDLPNIAVQAYDKNRKVLFWNDTSTQFYGYTKKEALGKVFEELLIPTEKKAWTKRKIDEWLQGDEPTKPGEYARRKKDGRIFIIYSSFIQIVNYHGEKEFFSLDIDLSSTKEAENKLKEALVALEESNKTKDKIFSIIGHDLRSPFNSLLGFTELLLDQFHDFSDEEKYDMIEVLRKNSLQAFNLLNNILEWSRQQMGKIKYKPGVEFLRPLADEIVGFLQNNADEKQLTLINSVNSRHLAYFDKGLVTVILRNLVSNAIKFTPAGGQVVINSYLEAKKLWVTVEDNGVGIQKKDIEKILHSQGDYTTLGTEGEKGTGLGLMLCRDFIRLNHGELKISSSPENGTTFSFSLPIYNQ